MKIPTTLLLIYFCISCQQVTETCDMVIEDVTIIDAKNSKLLPNQTIYIRQDRILKITPSKGNSGIIADTTINGKGKYVLPGFWDMHVHTSWKDNLDKTVFPIFLQYGITGIRDMGGSLEILNTFKNSAKIRPHLYPNLFGAGPILDGEKPIHPTFSISVTTKNFRIILDSLRNQKVDFLKVYSLLPSSVLDSISAYSKEKKIDFAGHISEYITPEMAAERGQKSFEHLNKLEELLDDSDRLNNFIGIANEHGSWLCPTLVIYQRKYEMANGEFFYHSLFEDLDKDLKLEWEYLKEGSTPKIGDKIKESTLRYHKQKQLVKAFYDHQIPLLIGTDFAGMQFVYPGYSYHEELKLMEEIGVPPFEILKMATWNPAVFLGISESYGTIEANKIADLVLFSENPVESIENTLSIDMVIKSGKIADKTFAKN
ncbi:MAG: amidohydrolase family protein [Arenibacter latericius]|nr:amidohydrolase family protein [Arenibacter latericius]